MLLRFKNISFGRALAGLHVALPGTAGLFDKPFPKPWNNYGTGCAKLP